MKKSFLAICLVFLIGFFTMSSLMPVFATPSSEIDKLTIDAAFGDANNIEGADEEVLQISLGGLNHDTDAGSKILSEYRNVIVGVSGIATLTFVILFIANFVKLGKSSGNPQERQNSIVALALTGIGAAGAGGVLLFVGFFYNLFL